jgi:hypothetical protein
MAFYIHTIVQNDFDTIKNDFTFVFLEKGSA